MFWRAVLYIEGCVATSLASAHYMSAACLSPLWGNQKCLQSLLSVLWWIKSALAENTFRSIEQHEPCAEFSPGSLGGKRALGPRGESLSSRFYHPSTLGRALWGPLSQPREDSSQRRGGESCQRAHSRTARPSERCMYHFPISQMFRGSAVPIEPSVFLLHMPQGGPYSIQAVCSEPESSNIRGLCSCALC